MNRPITEEESYADRRELFKNIWDTAVNHKETERNVIHKPKIIKTVRIDDVERCPVGKKKKQRIKHLRIVCNKILDFCDRQDTDDTFYEQTARKHRKSLKGRRAKKSRIMKIMKADKAKRMYSSLQDTLETEQSEITPDMLLDLDACFRGVAPVIETSQSVQENYHRKERRIKIEKFAGVKMIASRNCSIRRLFPINKVNI